MEGVGPGRGRILVVIGFALVAAGAFVIVGYSLSQGLPSSWVFKDQIAGNLFGGLAGCAAIYAWWFLTGIVSSGIDRSMLQRVLLGFAVVAVFQALASLSTILFWSNVGHHLQPWPVVAGSVQTVGSVLQIWGLGMLALGLGKETGPSSSR